MTARPQFNGRKKLSSFVFDADTKKQLKKLCPPVPPVSSKVPDKYPNAEVWGSRNDRNLDRWLVLLEEAARWASCELEVHKRDLTCEEVNKELGRLRKALTRRKDPVRLARMLRSISPDVDNLLGSDADPLGCADLLDESLSSGSFAETDDLVSALETLATRVQEAIVRAGAFRKTTKKKLHDAIASELLLRVRLIFAGFDAKVTSTAGARPRVSFKEDSWKDHYYYESKAVSVMTLMANAVGLEQQSALTWRDRIQQSNQESR